MSFLVRIDYDVYAADGTLVRHVVNHVSVMDATQVTIALPAGQYFVAIPDARWPSSWIAATIEPGRLTEADAKSPRPD